MTIKELRNMYNNYSVGQKIRCVKPSIGDRTITVDAIILQKYKWFVLVSHNNTRWCVQWIDIYNLRGL